VKSAAYAALVNPAPFDSVYGLRITESSEGLMRGEVPIVTELTQPLGMVHVEIHDDASRLCALGRLIVAVRELRES
jgi:acyl-coenzyme A thioesterase PaaI-like protein